MNKLFLILIPLLLGTHCLIGQTNFRIEANFSIKEKTPTGMSNLTMGTVFFDKNDAKIVYDISFPDKATLIVTDTIQYIVKGDSVRAQKNPGLNQLSVFNLALEGILDNFGLEQLRYEMINVEKDKDLVIMSWLPIENVREIFGKIVTSKKDRKLYGVVFFDLEDNVVSKQIFRKYETVNGVDFPQEIIQINIIDGQEYYKITSFNTIKVNNLERDEMYQYNLETLKAQ